MSLASCLTHGFITANVPHWRLWLYLNNFSRQPMLNKITKDEDKKRCQIYNVQPELKMIDIRNRSILTFANITLMTHYPIFDIFKNIIKQDFQLSHEF
jgi:hypothetical protein